VGRHSGAPAVEVSSPRSSLRIMAMRSKHSMIETGVGQLDAGRDHAMYDGEPLPFALAKVSPKRGQGRAV
jgi:hypothetical protein